MEDPLWLLIYWYAIEIVTYLTVAVFAYVVYQRLIGSIRFISWVPIALAFSAMCDTSFEIFDKQYFILLESVYMIGFPFIIIGGAVKRLWLRVALCALGLGFIWLVTYEHLHWRIWYDVTLRVVAWTLIVRSLITERVIMYEVVFRSFLAVICIFDMVHSLYWNHRLIIRWEHWMYIQAFLFIPLGVVRTLYVYYYGIKRLRIGS